MWSELLKSTAVFFLIVVGFILILLLPREVEINHQYGFVFTSEFPFTLQLYVENIRGFIDYFQTSSGFGTNRMGEPISEEVQRLLVRSLQIIIPAFLLSFTLGIMLGIVQFYFRKKFIGQIQAFFSWILSSTPDFFLYIVLQLLLIKLIQAGFPKFSLYGSEHWYSFIFPCIAVSIFPMFHMSKYTAALLEYEVSQNYYRAARAKGLRTIRLLIHKLWNCWQSLLNQSQFIMLYVLSSLPIIEILSNYLGAGRQLLFSIRDNEDVRALALILPFLFLMYITVLVSKVASHWLVPQKSGDAK